MDAIDSLRGRLGRGLVIPACPLALTGSRRFDERRQRALVRYYRAAGAGGLAVAVHTTQFGIRDPGVGLLKPVLGLVAEELGAALQTTVGPDRPVGGMVRIAGVCGVTPQAVAEAELARSLGYEAVLVSLGALRESADEALLQHCRRVAEVLPVIGFYLQPAAGGRVLSHAFWRRFAEIPEVVAIKIAPFNRYRTLDVIRAVAESGRTDIALYTGNDDAIVADLVTPFRWGTGPGGEPRELRIVGGLLGHWAVWTRRAVELHRECRTLSLERLDVPRELLVRGVEVTDANAAFFDAANGFAGCIAGLHEVLRRQGLFEGIWCLDPNEGLGPGQRAEIDRVCRAYPHLADDAFVEEHRDTWLR